MLRNPFPIIAETIDLNKYKDQLNHILEKFYNEFFEKYEILSLKKLEDVFWKLVKNTVTFNPIDWYHNFAVWIVQLFSTQLLLDEGKILPETHEIFINWFLYLSKRMIPIAMHISSDFFRKLYSDDLIPEPDLEAAISILHENKDLIKNYDFPSVLYDENIPMPERLRIFQVYYIGFYEVFRRKCVYIEKQLFRHEGRPHALIDIRDIFQINNDNDRTPPPFPRAAIYVLIHVRNSCAHRNMTILSDGRIRVRDYKTNGEISYDNNRTITQLYEYFHALMILEKGFNVTALAIMLKRRIEIIYGRYARFIECPDCRKNDVYCILPNNPIKFIICKNCRFPFKPN